MCFFFFLLVIQVKIKHQGSNFELAVDAKFSGTQNIALQKHLKI